MLSELHVHPTIPAADMDRARKFYEETLGFKPNKERPGGVVYDCKDSWFVLFPSPNAGQSPNTLAGWQTDDIEKTVKELRDKGVVFEEYDYPTLKTENGIASFPANRSAWFKDTEGNILGIVQFLD